MCIEFKVFGKKEKKNRLEVQKWPRQATAHFWVWVTTELSGSMSRHGSQVAGVAESRQSCFLLVFYHDRGPPYVVTVFYSLS